MTAFAISPSRTWTWLSRFGAWGLLDQAALSLSGFVIVVLVARTGGIAELGLFTLVQGGLLIFAGLVKSAFGDPIVIERKGDRDNRLPAVGPVVVGVHLIFGITLLPIAYLTGASHWLDSPGSALPLLLLFLPMAGFYEPARAVRLADRGEKQMFLGDLFVAAARVISGLLLGLVVQGAILGLWAWIAGGLVSLLTVNRRWLTSLQISDVSRCWQMGRWFLGDGLLYTAGQYGIWMIVVPVAGVSLAGQMRGAQQLFAPVQLVVVGMSTILLSRLAEHRGRFTTDARMMAVLQIGLMAFWSMFVAVFGSRLASFVFGTHLNLASLELVVLGAAFTVGTAYAVSASILRSRAHGRRLVTARFVTITTTLVLVVLVGDSFTGVALSLLGGNAVGAILALASIATVSHSRSASTEVGMDEVPNASHFSARDPANE